MTLPADTLKLDFPHDWTSPYRVNLDFLTDIGRSRSGREQRAAIRRTPRRSVELSILLRPGEMDRFRRYLLLNQHRKFVLPEIVRLDTTETVLDGSTSTVKLAGLVRASTNQRVYAQLQSWCQVGAWVALMYEGQWSARRISAVQSATSSDVETYRPSVTFDTLESEVWPVGTTIHPLMFGYLTETVDSKRLTNRSGRVALTFELDPGSDPFLAGEIPIPPFRFEAPSMYDRFQQFVQKDSGSSNVADRIPLLVHRPNWRQEVTDQFFRQLDLIDYQKGRTARFNHVPFTERTTTMNFLLRAGVEVENFRGFWNRATGQLGEFYCPTFDEDMKLREKPVAGSSTIRVVGSEVYDTYSALDRFKRIWFQFRLDDRHQVVLPWFPGNDLNTVGTGTNRLPNGFIWKVLGMALISDEQGTDTVLTLDRAWTTSLLRWNLDEVKTISWLPLCRFASDNLVLDWPSVGVCRAQVPIKTLEDVY